MHVRDYLARIGAEGHPPSRDAFQLLHQRHLLAVPFENIDIHLGVPILLDESRILDKIVRRRRGGFCYELNSAFGWLLRGLGYDVVVVSAEVARAEGGFGIPFDHMALLVAVESETFLGDVGFGESFRAPLPLSDGTVHDEGEFRYRLRRDDAHWIVEQASPDEPTFTPQYRFTPTSRGLGDFRSGCDYHQTSPDSHFTQSVITSRALPDGRVTLTRDALTFRRGAGRTRTEIPDETSWRNALQEHFDIVLENPR